MHYNPDQATAILRRTPSTLDTLLRGLPEAWTHADEGPETWSPFDVIGHLVFGEETDWIPRANLILQHGEAGKPPRPFEPFDRFAQERLYQDWPLERLLDTFHELRHRNLDTLASFGLDDDKLALPGAHPELGPVTLGQLLAAWVVHDLGHIAQISRVMAKQYQDEVGPWPQYLPILGR